MTTLSDSTRLLSLPILVFGVIAICYRFYINQSSHNPRLVMPVVIGTGFMIISTLSALQKPINWNNHLLRVSTMHFSAMCVYLMGERVLNDDRTKSILSRPIVWVTIGVTIIVLLLDSGRKMNLGFLMDQGPVNVDWLYAASYLISYSFMFITAVAASNMWWNHFHRLDSLEFKIRTMLTVLGFAISAIMSASVHVNVISYILYGDKWRDELSRIYHMGKPFTFLFLMTAVIAPSKLYNLVIPDFIKDFHKQYQYKQLLILHKRLMQIVPKADRAYGKTDLRIMRLLIDIIDARDMIFSHLPPGSMSIKKEARHIVELIAEKEIVNEGGDFTPILNDTAMAHALALAYYVDVYERRLKIIHSVSKFFIKKRLITG